MSGRLSLRGRGGVLRVRDFRLLWLGQTVSTVGDQLFPIAVSIRVLDGGGNAGDLGLVLAARFLALVLFVLVGGVWADRLPRKLMMMGSDAFRGTAVLGLALVPGQVPVAVLAALTFLVGGGEAFFRPAYGALLPSVLPPDELGAGNALTSVSVRGASILGPAVAGVMVAAVGPRPAFVLDACTFAVSLVTLTWLREPAYDPAPRSSMLGEMGEGIAEVRARPWVLAVLLVASVQLMFLIAPESVLLPIISRRELGGDRTFGLALAFFAVGGLVGALAAIRWRPRQPGLVAVLGLLPLALLPLALLYPVASWTVYAAYLLGGLGLEPFMVFWAVALQREIPKDRLARVTSLDWMCSLALLPLGLALVGPAVRVLGEGPVLWTAVVVAVVPTLLCLLVPGMLGFRTPQTTSHEPEPVGAG